MARRDFAGLERRRMRAVRLFAQGETQAEVARLLGVSRTTAMRWARALKHEGKQGLRAAGRAGRKPRLSTEQLKDAEAVLFKGPVAFGYPTAFWTLPRVAEVIERVTGIRYHPGHVWRVLRKLGWSRQKPTTRARERDEQAIERWVKTTWPALKKKPHAKQPRSSSSTKAASPSGRRSNAPGRRAGRHRS